MGKLWKHFKTICLHKKYVYEECKACGLLWQGIVHDLSKFSPTEFVPSAKYFQGDRSPISKEKEEIGYSKAWLHHKGRNKHHWEYWTDFDDNGNVTCVKIPFKYVVEMVCDWIGAGKAYSKEKWENKSPLDYYIAVRSGRHFHPETEDLILKFLNCIKEYGLEEFHDMAKCGYGYAYLQADYDHPGMCP